ncbi:MFS transporter [Clostridium oryzae]|uniref:3-(3-hydroxy-phenyl)propionate transporter n=1 Tax=Clostridium oryzae TaxID=1450648 RepID=A0A1V4IVR4_9CLOT|nr:MFS transporter [Clostridium oryzae]OPJ63983.1 3-(3-hydroxy-phenyl)propionate transporter [Clostridium oryzae]
MKENPMLKIAKIFNPYRGLSREIYIIALGRMINAAGSFIFPLITLILTLKIGINKTTAGYIVSVAGVMFTLSGIIGGKLTDHFGRKKILVLFNSLGAIFYLIAAGMGTSIYIVPMVIFSGFMLGIAGPASGGLVADITTPKTRDGAYSLFYMAMNVGFTISPIIGGPLLKHYLWLLFLLDGTTSLIAALLILIFIPESIHKTKEKLGEDRKFEQRVEGSIFKVLLERPILIFFALVMFGYNFVYSEWSYLYPLHAAKLVPSNGSGFYGLLVSVNAIIVITMTPMVTRLISGRKSIARICLGGLLYTVGFGMLGFINAVPFMYVSVTILTLGEIVVTTSADPFIVNNTPASHRGRMEAVLPIIIGLGSTIGPTVTGIILKFTTIGNTWKFVGLVMLVFTLLTYILYSYNEKINNKGKVTM